MSSAASAARLSAKTEGLAKPVSGAPGVAAAAPRTARFDRGLVLGLVFAFGALIAGIAASAAGLAYFLQPTGALIVLGGTVGVILITTPAHSLLDSVRRVRGLFAIRQPDREALIEEIVQCARAARRQGTLCLEPLAHTASMSLLRDGMLLALDVTDKNELRVLLESDLRMRERQGEMDAKVLEVAGGFAPTIGILGTVVGLIDVLRHFQNAASIGSGIGCAFVSTIYGLALANLVLLPLANRIRSRVSDAFEVQELIMEGVIAMVDGTHPFVIRQRLKSFVRQAAGGAAPGAAAAGERISPLERLRMAARAR